MSTPFTRRMGVTQGRIQPTGVLPGIGDYVYCLGSDLRGDVQRVKDGDSVTLSQTSDVTGVALLRFRFRARPAAPPTTYLDDADGTTHNGTAFFRLSWGVGSDEQGSRSLVHGRPLDVSDGCIDLSQVTGDQTIWFKLAVTT